MQVSASITIRSAGHYWASICAEALVKQGVTTLCIAPGSRSTPLVKAMHDHKDIQIYTHYDERSLGFFALGLAKASNKAVAIVTTSGTAVANLMPSCAEAFNMQVPLIILSADRPEYLHACGANQTMTQEGILDAFTVASLNLPTADLSIQSDALKSELSAVLSHCKDGPIHINCPFDEPLLEEEKVHLKDNEGQPLKASVKLNSKRQATSVAKLDPSRLNALCMNKKVLCVSAMLQDGYKADSLYQSLKKAGIPIVAECSSAMPYDEAVHRKSEQWIQSIEKPDLVLAIGSKWLSKPMQGFLKEAEQVILLHDFDESQDFLRCATYEASIKHHDLSKVIDELQVNPTYAITVPELSNEDDEAYSLIQAISESRDGIENLFLGNSMPIRHMNRLFKPKEQQFNTFANRGVSGIDGIISSAAGVAATSKQPTLLLNGDMSSLHDTNGFYFLSKYQLPLLVIIINNNGGGIFKKLPIKDETDIFEPYFQMPHHLNFKHIAACYKLNYKQTSDPKELSAFIQQFKMTLKPSVVEWI